MVEREMAALMSTYCRYPVEFVRGEGAWLFDADGRGYLDCMSGISMNNVGHCHPAVVAAIRDQAGRLINTSNLYYTEPMVALAEWIRDTSMGGRVFFCNSGAEASEAAIKLARKHGGPARTEFVTLEDGFHGRTMGALAMTGQPDKQSAFRPLMPGVTYVRRNDGDALRDAVTDRTCAIAIEIVQGECGVHPLDADFVRLARGLADDRGALLIVDEIQTGMSRTGPLYAYLDLGIEPDVMCLAKSLGGGVPIGAITARPGIDATFQPGDHGSTFAGSPLACASALAAAHVLSDPDLQAHVRREGATFLTGLQSLVDDGLATQARGRGLMCAIDLPTNTGAQVVAAMLERGVLVNNTSPGTVRFLPPLVITRDELATVLAALRDVLPRD
ncbi:MAG: acetylornithine/succinylornithine family transaminase [Thermoleophilia bacterium]|nr:acetylornithine/succinylornithine family transaminase [Thermoleophilia bacterium]